MGRSCQYLKGVSRSTFSIETVIQYEAYDNITEFAARGNFEFAVSAFA